MKVCILQPSYIPWKGYFHQIAKSDVFVFFDTVQYDRRGWRNRNQIKTPKGPAWLTIPVNAHGTHEGLLIKDVHVTNADWAAAHLQRIKQCYKEAPFFRQEFPWIEAMLLDAARHSEIGGITAQCTELIARRIGIRNTRFVYASTLGVDSNEPNDRLLHICQAIGARTYLSGPSAKSYMDTAVFETHNIAVEWMEYNYSEYPQLFPPFTHQVSILDLIFIVGSEQTGEYIWEHPDHNRLDAIHDAGANV